ncbi:MAG: metallophosphoesterase [Proteobacteria bacterium]|nr:metallophosphoesterase [Pseudomonadota bacterium]
MERLGAAVSAPACNAVKPLATRFPAAHRIVAIGDLHGDLSGTRAVLQLAGAIDHSDQWSGGNLVVIQLGDILDRGNDEQDILDWLETLAEQANAAGGAVHVLNGNHELMNAAGDFRYVTAGGFADFRDIDRSPSRPAAPLVENSASHSLSGRPASCSPFADLPPGQRARAAAFFPGGRYARILARHQVIIMVGDTVFVHGGVLPQHAAHGIERINREVQCWLLDGGPIPQHIASPGSPVWSRHYSMPPEHCAELEKTLALLGATRMVVGHTTQRSGITTACNGRVWRIDTGISVHYGGRIEALEIRQLEVPAEKARSGGKAGKLDRGVRILGR